MALPHEFVVKHSLRAKGGQFLFEPLDKMSGDELLAVIGYLMLEIDSMRTRHGNELDTLSNFVSK